MSGLFFRIGGECESIGGWFRCLRCYRFFTKKVDELYCYDCCAEVREDS